MSETFNKREPVLVALRERQKRRNRVVATLGSLVVLAVAVVLMLPAISMTHDDLICGMEEHVHTDACYETVLSCGLDEGDAHQHSDACYEKVLACGIEEHVHNDACYPPEAPEPTTEQADDQDTDDGDSEGVDEDGDDADAGDVEDGDDADDAEADGDGEAESPDDELSITTQGLQPGEAADDAKSDYPAQTFQADLVDNDNKPVLTVLADAPEGALPAGSFMKIDGVDAAEVASKVEAALSYDPNLAGKVEASRLMAVDIEFTDADGNAVEPAAPVKVKLNADLVHEVAQEIVEALATQEAEGVLAAGAEELQAEGEIPISAIAANVKNPVVVHVLDKKKAKEAGKLDADGKPMKAEIASNVKLVNWVDDTAAEAERAAGDGSEGDEDSVDSNVEPKGNEDTLKLKAEEFGVYVIAELRETPTEGADAADDADVDPGDAESDDGNDAESRNLITTVNRPAQQFSEQLTDADGSVTLAVDVDAPEGALPEGATMQLTPVTKESVLDAVKEAAAAETDIDARRAEAIAADITFFDADGVMVEPLAELRVTMAAPAIAQAADGADEGGEGEGEGAKGAKDAKPQGAESAAPTDLAVVHVPDGKAAEVIASADVDAASATAEFDSAKFSIYAIVYTVDFHYEIDGKTFDFSIQGGDAISLKELLVVLNAVDAEEVQEFVDSIETVEFSDPELIHVAKVEEDTTAGALKEKYELEPEYSASLSDEQIAEIDAKEFAAIDWALTTLKAFDTEETLTITLADGEVFTIKVTDARDPWGIDDRTFAIVSQYGSAPARALGSTPGSAGSGVGGAAYNYLQGQTVTCTTKSDAVYCNKEARAWLFEYDATGEGYRVSDGYNSQDARYLHYNDGQDGSGNGYWEMVEGEENATLIKLEKNDDGTFCLSDGAGHYLARDAGGNTIGDGDDNFSVGIEKNDAAKLTLCLPEGSDDSASHKATLISAQDLIPGQNVVIYQRVLYFNDNDPNDAKNNTYTYYALADDASKSDGSAAAVQLWNSGDSVYWRGDPAVTWTFKEAKDPETGEPTGYYFFENMETGRYLAAKADGTLIQDLDANPDFADLTKVNEKADHVQIALPGLRTSSYTSKIANWDYNMNVTSGPKVNDENHDALPESISSVALDESQEFYFAVRDPVVQRQLTEVDTVDSASKGIKITMYDFRGNSNLNQGGERLNYMDTVIGTPEWAQGVYRPGIMDSVLVDGWPQSKTTGRSLEEVFNPTNATDGFEVNRTQTGVNHLFINSVYESTGYFRYSAFENYAYLPADSSDFKVYEQIGSPAREGDNDYDAGYMKRGNFFPFNDLDITTWRENLVRPENTSDLDDTNPRKGEDLYATNGHDYFFGMTMEAKFQQGQNGKNDRGDPMRYDFNGDDDLWIYVDDVLLLDIGGVHDAFHGYIDFTTGTIHVDKQNTNTSDCDTTIKRRFWEAGLFPDGSTWDHSLYPYDSDMANEYFTGETFKDYSSHDFKMFYMERGAGASNLDMQFNLTVLPYNQFKVTKEMPGTSTDHVVQNEYGNTAFYYQAYKADASTDQPTLIKKGDTVAIEGVTYTYENIATYENGSPLVWKQDAQGEWTIFEVRPGHSAIFPVANRSVRYYAQEVEPEAGSTMLENFDVTNSSPETDPAQPEKKQLLTNVKSVQQRAEVIFWNSPDDRLVNELRITKNLHGQMLTNVDGSPVLSAIGIPYFEYAVYLEDNDGKMVPYSLGEYYIIDKQGRYVYYEGGVRHYYGFAKNADGTYSYYRVSPAVEGEGSDATPELGELVETTPNPKKTDNFGEDGLVWDIRDGDTLVIVGLTEGTHYIVSERTYGENKPHVTTNPRSEGYLNGEKYLYDSAEVHEVVASGETAPEGEHVTGNLFYVPENAETIKSQLSKPANSDIAEGDIRLGYDTEVTVHNRSKSDAIPVVVQKKWAGIDSDDALLSKAKVKVTLGRYVLKDQAGNLTIKKTGVPNGVNFTAYYSVKDTDGNTVAVVQYSSKLAGEDGVTVNVPPGTYTVVENVVSQDAGYEWNHSGSSSAQIEISDDGTASVAFTCAPVMKTGNLKVVSSYSIPEGGSVDFTGVTYTVYAGDENSTMRATYPDGSPVPVITYDQASADDGFTISGLKAGTYTVKENGVPIDSSDGGYTLTDHTPENAWHVTKDVANDSTETATFSSTYTQARTNINYMIGKPSSWSSTERISGTNSSFAPGKTVKLTFHCSGTWDRIGNCVGQTDNGTSVTSSNVVTYAGQSLSYSHSRNDENGNSRYEMTFVVQENADLRVFLNANPNSSEFWGMTWEEVQTNKSAARALAKAPTRAATDSGDESDAGDEGSTDNASAASAELPINYGSHPTAPDGKKYVEDATFGMQDPKHDGELLPYTVVLTKNDYKLDEQTNTWCWEWDSVLKNANLPSADEDGNKYYYYIKSVEETGMGFYTNPSVKLESDGETFLVGEDKNMTASVDNTVNPPTKTYTPEPLEVYNEVRLVELGVKKAWKPDNANIAPEGAEVTVELYYAKRAMTNADGEVIAEGDRGEWPDASEYLRVRGSSELAAAKISPTELVLSAASSPAWQGSFQKLPTAILGSDGIVYELDYYAKEISVKIPGKNKQVVDDTAVDVTNKYTTTVSKTEPEGEAANTSDGTVVITNTKETVQVTVQKVWDPLPTDPNASVTVALHRYAKKTAGTIGVVLKDDHGAGIAGAAYKLQKKNGEIWEDVTDVAVPPTDVNGRTSVSGLEAGTYKLVQVSTPEAYKMGKAEGDTQDTFNYVIETEELTVVGNTTEPQSLWTDNANKCKISAGVVTLTVSETVDGSPVGIQGVTVDLYRDTEATPDAAGLVTDDNGQVSVSNLVPGEYYFVITALPDDYAMPESDLGKTSVGFVIDEVPGVEQIKADSITNIKQSARGMVTVNLKQANDNATPIAGAGFTLTGTDVDGNPVSLSGTTDENGQIVFGSPSKLHAGRYTVHQAAAPEGFKPAAKDQMVEIKDVPDNNQGKTLDFINVIAGKATVTVTVQKENNAGPVVGAAVQLKQGNTVVRSGTTDSAGQVVFTNVGEGTYTVHQVNTGEAGSAYAVAANPEPFTVVEGNASQTFSYELTNSMQSVTIIVRWRQNTSDQWTELLRSEGAYCVGDTIILGYYRQTHNNNLQLWVNDVQIPLEVGLYVSGTPQAESQTITLNAETVYISFDNDQWGDMRPDSGRVASITSGSRGVSAAPVRVMSSLASAPARAITTLADTIAGGGSTRDGNALAGAADEPDADAGEPTRDGEPTPAVTDAQPVKVPADVANQYMEDSTFQVKTYTIESKDDWEHVFGAEDKCDANGDPYYYYVVETGHTPGSSDGYYIQSYSDDPLSSTGTITITNKQQRGSLAVTKNVTVNGAPIGDNPTAETTALFNNLVDGEYTFNIVGTAGTATANYSGTVKVTIANGVAASATVNDASVELPATVNDLIAGEYTVTEVNPKNGTSLVGGAAANGIHLTVRPGVTTGADVPVASFTNNIDTTQLQVKKVWTDGNDGHSAQTINYSIRRIPYVMSEGARVEYPTEKIVSQQTADATLVPTMNGYTGKLGYDSSTGETTWAQTVTGLPATGIVHDNESNTDVLVSYDYYVKEETVVEGYKTSVEPDENVANGFGYIITNEPKSPTDQETQVDVEKKWKKADSTDDADLHKGDSVVFNVVQKKYVAKVKYTYNETTYEKKLYPITINLKDKNGNSGGNRVTRTMVVYVPEGTSFTICPHWMATDRADESHQHVLEVSGITPDGTPATYPHDNHPGVTYYDPDATYTIANVNEAKEVTLSIYDGNDVWKSLYERGKTTNMLKNPGQNDEQHNSDRYQWQCELYSPQGIIWDLNTMITMVTTGAADTTVADPTAPTPVLTPYEYEMKLSGTDDGLPTVFEGVGTTPGNPEGSGNDVWKGSIKNLQLYEYKNQDGNAYVYQYEVTEARIGSDSVNTQNPPVMTVDPDTQQPTAYWSGQTSKYLVEWHQNADKSWTATNQRKPTDITVKKYKASELGGPDAALLPGATFKLQKFTDNTYQNQVLETEWADHTVADEPDGQGGYSQNGSFTFTDLYAGYYLLVEDPAPAGYNRGPDIRFHVADDMTVELLDESGEVISEGATELALVNNDANPPVISVGNNPGKSLPNTGGPGTLVYLLGGIAVVAAATGFLGFTSRRRHERRLRT